MINQALVDRMDDAARKRTAAFLNSCLNLLEEEFANLGGELRSIRALSKACW